MQEGHDQEGEREGDHGRNDVVEDTSKHRLAERADTEAGGGNAELHRGDEARRPGDEREHRLGALASLLLELTQTGTASRHEAVLGRHEKRVQKDQSRDGE